jgi:hypothetical protein
VDKHNFPTNATKNSVEDAVNSVIFADYILKWLPKQIRVRNLSQTLANALSDDTHEISIHLSSYRTHHSIKWNKNKTKSFVWSKERRFFHILLDILDGKPNLLPKAFGIPMKNEDNQAGSIESDDFAPLEDDIDPEYQEYYTPKANEENSLEDEEESYYDDLDWCKEIQQQRQLTLEQRQEFGRLKISNGTLYLNLRSLIKSKRHKQILNNWWIYGDLGGGLSPINLVSGKYNELVQKNYGKKDWEPSSKELRHCMSLFTRKLNPYLSNRINAYWYRVKYVEFDPQKKRQRKKRYIIVKSYEKLVYCIVFEELFGKERKSWDENFNQYQQLSDLFNDKFKTNTKHPYDCSVEFLKQYRVKLSQFEDQSPEIIDQDSDENCPECGGKMTLDKPFWYCDECGLEEEQSPANANEEGESSTRHEKGESTTSQEKAISYSPKLQKMMHRLKFSKRRKTWQKKIEEFKDALILKIESIKYLTEEETDNVEVRIQRLQREIRRCKERSQSQEK